MLVQWIMQNGGDPVVQVVGQANLSGEGGSLIANGRLSKVSGSATGNVSYRTPRSTKINKVGSGAKRVAVGQNPKEVAAAVAIAYDADTSVPKTGGGKTTKSKTGKVPSKASGNQPRKRVVTGGTATHKTDSNVPKTGGGQGAVKHKPC